MKDNYTHLTDQTMTYTRYTYEDMTRIALACAVAALIALMLLPARTHAMTGCNYGGECRYQYGASSAAQEAAAIRKMQMLESDAPDVLVFPQLRIGTGTDAIATSTDISQLTRAQKRALIKKLEKRMKGIRAEIKELKK